MRKIARALVVALLLVSAPASAQVLQGYQTIPTQWPMGITPAPIAAYEIDELAGPTLHEDISGLNGNFVGGPTFNDNPVSPNELGAVKITSSTSAHTAINLPGSGKAPYATSDFSFALMIRTNNAGTVNRQACTSITPTTNLGWCLSSGAVTSSDLNLIIGTGTGTQIVTISNGMPPVGNIGMIGVSYTNSTGIWNVYANNTGISQFPASTSQALQNDPAIAYIAVGSAPISAGSCGCSINDAIVWNVALTQAQFDANFTVASVRNQ